MATYPSAIQELIKYFNRLPGIGPKSAERLVFYLLKKDPRFIQEFSQSLNRLNQEIKYCSTCHNISQTNPCYLCQNTTRNAKQICVVPQPQDLMAIEKTGQFQGLYHVLWGNLNPLRGITPDDLKISELLYRIEKDQISELILAFSSNLEGDATILYLQQQLADYPITISRLAQGLSSGSELEYADEQTLTHAFSNRKSL